MRSALQPGGEKGGSIKNGIEIREIIRRLIAMRHLKVFQPDSVEIKACVLLKLSDCGFKFCYKNASFMLKAFRKVEAYFAEKLKAA